jgi:hypothetical protein
VKIGCYGNTSLHFKETNPKEGTSWLSSDYSIPAESTIPAGDFKVGVLKAEKPLSKVNASLEFRQADASFYLQALYGKFDAASFNISPINP